jgi:hypothetical protein
MQHVLEPPKGRFARIACAALASTLLLAPTAWASSLPLTIDPQAGFTVLTAEDGVTTAADLMVVEFRGPIASPMSDDLRKVWEEARKDGRFRRFALRLDSAGGNDLEGPRVISVLSEIREHAHLTTIVGEGDLCASMCVALFIQGEDRYASPASSWMFHGTSMRLSNVPDPARTDRHFDLFRARNIDSAFIDYLYTSEYVTRPGAFWLSGRELFEQSNIITHLLPNWRPAAPRHQPMQVMQSSR